MGRSVMVGLLLGALWMPAAAVAQAVIGVPPEFSVESERGAALTITDVQAGEIRLDPERRSAEFATDSAGNVARWTVVNWDVVEGAPVPLRVGVRFGYSFTLPRIDENDAIVINIKVEHPTVVTKAGHHHTCCEVPITFRKEASNEPRYIGWEFREEAPEYHQRGTWTINLYNKGRLLASKSFVVQD